MSMKETKKIDLQIKPNEKYLESGILLRLYWYYSYTIIRKATLYTFKLWDLQNHENNQNLPPEILDVTNSCRKQG